MPHKITLIVSSVCLTFIGAWYLDFIPESLVPFMFFIIIVIGLHIVIDLLIVAWEPVYKLIRKK